MIKASRADAEALLRQTAATYPDAVWPLYALAAHLIKEKRVDVALALLDKVRALDPVHLGVNTLLGVTYAHLAASAPVDDAEGRSAHIEAAREAYTAALKRRSDDIAVLVAYGRLELQAGHPHDGLPLLQRALFVDPDHLEANVVISEVYSELGHDESAALQLWRARRLERDRPRRLSKSEYRQRLLELYERLTASEAGRANLRMSRP